MKSRRVAFHITLALAMLIFSMGIPASAESGERAGNVAEERNFLMQLGQRMTAYLTNLKSAVEKSTAIGREKQRQVSDELASDISAIQLKTAAAIGAVTGSEVRERMTALREQWQTAERRMRYYGGLVALSRVTRALERLDDIHAKVETLLSRLETQERMTDALRELRQQFVEELEQARAEQQLAQQEFNAILQDEKNRERFLEGFKHLREAHRNLQKARLTFRKLLVELKQSFPAAAEPVSSTTQPVEP